MSRSERRAPIDDVVKGDMPSTESSDNPGEDNDYLRLRRLLLGDDYSSALKRYVSKEDDADRVAEVLPTALKSSSQSQLGEALAPVVDKAIASSIEENPTRITNILFPIMGPAIRKAVSSALAEMVQSLNTLLEQSLTLGSITWRIRAWRAGMPYATYVLLETIQYRVEQVLLVHRETGLLLNSLTASEVDAQDPELVSSMLSAISDFVSDSFSGGRETLERIRFGDLELQLLVGPHAVLAVAVRGKASDELALKANTTIEAIHAQFSYPLNHFDGDRTPFEATDPILSECLLTQKVDQKSKRKPWLAMVLLLIAFGYFMYSSFIEWQREQQYAALEYALDEEPGYVVISSKREGNTLSFNVIRATDSRSVESVQAVLLEGKQIGLNINASVMHFGPLPKPIVERTSPDAEFRELADRIQSTVFYFEPNEARLSEAELLKIPEVLNNIAELESRADAGGYTDLQITVLGFADGSGSAIRNQAVSQQRADGIRAILSANSVSSDILVAWGVGSIDQSEVAERMQRRVTIQVLYSMPSRGLKNDNEVDMSVKKGDPS